MQQMSGRKQKTQPRTKENYTDMTYFHNIMILKSVVISRS